jgi:hypothetical protein
MTRENDYDKARMLIQRHRYTEAAQLLLDIRADHPEATVTLQQLISCGVLDKDQTGKILAEIKSNSNMVQ